MHSDSGLSGLTFTRPSLVKTQFADECDLSKIVSRFIRTGELPNLQMKKPLSVQDVSNLPTDYEEIQNRRVQVQQAFESLPLETREKFLHDPERWLEFLETRQDPPKDPPQDPPKDPPKDPPQDSPKDTP